MGWAPKLIDTDSFGQAPSAVNMASCLLRRGLFHRIDDQVPPRTFAPDRAACADQLSSMGRQIAELNENLSVLKASVLDGRPFEPLREGPDGQGSGGANDNGVGSRRDELMADGTGVVSSESLDE
jgi:hypothetical protein